MAVVVAGLEPTHAGAGARSRHPGLRTGSHSIRFLRQPPARERVQLSDNVTHVTFPFALGAVFSR